MHQTNINRNAYALTFWIVLPSIAMVLGNLWQQYVHSLMDVYTSYALESLVLILLILFVSRVFFRYINSEYNGRVLFRIGFIWAILFFAFNLVDGLYFLALPLDSVLSNYNAFAGRFGLIVLLVVFLCPRLFGRIPEDDPDLTSMPIGKMATIGLLPSGIKIAYYRRKGAEIGEGVSIGLLSILECKKVVIGDHAKIGMACMIRANEFRLGRYSKLGMLVIIDTHKVTIGEEVTIQEQVYIGGLKTDKSVIEIGDLSMIFSGSVLNPTHPIKIGKRVGIGGYNYLFTHGTWQPILDGFPVAFGPITIEDGVWFPWRVFVLPNVHIGKEATIGAGAVVNKDVPARALAAGVPAKVLRRDDEYIRRFTDAEKREILRNVLVDLVGYLRIEDWIIEDPRIEESHAAAMFRTPKGPSSKVDNHILFMFENTDDVWSLVKDRTLVVSLITLDETQRKMLEEEGSWWFDLETSEWGGLHTNVSVMMSGFLSRYGHWLKYMS